MRKKVTNDDVAMVIGAMADKIRKEMNEELIIAKNEMMFAEMDLVETLTEEQRVLYNEFVNKRQVYYSYASEMYEKKY